MSCKNLQRAERKIRIFHKLEWVGYLTPSEIFALIEDGVIPSKSSATMLDYHQDRLKKGYCSPSWFYFFPSKQQLKRWGK